MCHVFGQFGSEKQFLACAGVNESQCLGVQRLPGTNGEAIVHKLFVFTKMSSFQYFVPSVTLVIEQYVSDVFHVYTYLVRASGFEYAFHEGDISQTFQYLINALRHVSLA